MLKASFAGKDIQFPAASSIKTSVLHCRLRHSERLKSVWDWKVFQTISRTPQIKFLLLSAEAQTAERVSLSPSFLLPFWRFPLGISHPSCSSVSSLLSCSSAPETHFIIHPCQSPGEPSEARAWERALPECKLGSQSASRRLWPAHSRRAAAESGPRPPAIGHFKDTSRNEEGWLLSTAEEKQNRVICPSDKPIMSRGLSILQL